MGSPKRILLLGCSILALATAGTVLAAASGLYNLSDDEASGPTQPIDFSHALHAGEMGIQCLYCHTGADKGQHATVPAVSVCWGCHQFVKKGPSEGSEQEIAKIEKFMCRQAADGVPAEVGNPLSPCTEGTSIEWVRIHNLPEYVQFRHMRHVNAGIECQQCHGEVQNMQRVWLVPDTVLRPSSAFLPARKLEMGWCLNCHEQNNATNDCAACHY